MSWPRKFCKKVMNSVEDFDIQDCDDGQHKRQNCVRQQFSQRVRGILRQSTKNVRKTQVFWKKQTVDRIGNDRGDCGRDDHIRFQIRITIKYLPGKNCSRQWCSEKLLPPPCPCRSPAESDDPAVSFNRRPMSEKTQRRAVC